MNRRGVAGSFRNFAWAAHESVSVSDPLDELRGDLIAVLLQHDHVTIPLDASHHG